MSIKQDIAYEFADFVSKKRKELGLSVRDLGEKANVSYTALYDFEIRKVFPRINTLIKLLETLGFDVNCQSTGDGFILWTSTKDMIKDLPLFKTVEPTPEEKLMKILSQKGLTARESEEVLNFINYQLSKRKGKYAKKKIYR